MPATHRYSPSELRSRAGAPSFANYRLKLLSTVNSMPPLPIVLTRLLGLLNSEETSAGQVAQLVECDNVLSGNLLRSVNSALYSFSERTASVRQAVTLLGFRTVRNLALSFSMRRLIAGKQPAPHIYAAYSRHAMACALMTQLLAIYTRSEELDSAFAAGLFHDVGKLLILTTLPDAVPRVLSRWESGEKTYIEAEEEILEVTHPELSYIVLGSWKLPDKIREAGRYHHAPENAASPAGQDAPPSLARLVHAANLAVNFRGYQTIDSKKRQPEPADAAFESLGLEKQTEAILEKFDAEYAVLRNAFR